jgi:hypothetical protein
MIPPENSGRETRFCGGGAILLWNHATWTMTRLRIFRIVDDADEQRAPSRYGDWGRLALTVPVQPGRALDACAVAKQREDG